MRREIQSIPPTPRVVKWRAVLWHWFPVAFAGFALGIYGGLITLMTFMAADGKPADDRLIDFDAQDAMGTVTELRGGDSDERGRKPIRITYKFTTPGGRELEGEGFLERPDIRIGDPLPVEFSARMPHKSRPKGGRISLAPQLHRFFFWTMFLPGMLCIVTWWLAVLRIRRVLQFGDIAVAEVKAIETLRYVLPTMYRVAYVYRDHHARERTESHWVRARSALGQRLATAPEQVAVAHSRTGRGASRLVMADDFVLQHAGRDDPSHTRNS